MTRKKIQTFSKNLLQPFSVFASAFFENKFEWAKNLDLEVWNDALSFEIKKYRGQNFREDSYARWSHGPPLKLFIELNLFG
jgi:hypothetical protein